jgi:hypothetical protein
MKTTPRLIALAVAVAVNAAALAALHTAMVRGTEQALAANVETEHVVVSAERAPGEMAHSNCPASRAL